METKDNFKVPKWSFAALGLVLVCLMSCRPVEELKPEEWPTDRIERITGVRLPEYEVTRFFLGPVMLMGDFTDTLYIEFESIPSDELFEKIDSIRASKEHSAWYTSDSIHYSYHKLWGNGDPAPKGEDPNADRIFEIEITKGEKTGIIVYGMW